MMSWMFRRFQKRLMFLNFLNTMVINANLGWEKNVADLGQGKTFFENLIVQILFVAGLLPTLVSFGLLSYFVRPGNIIVLHYNVYFGVDLLGVWWQAYILPFLGLLFFLGHFFLARRFYRRGERIAAYLMLLAAGMLALGILIGSASIAFINY